MPIKKPCQKMLSKIPGQNHYQKILRKIAKIFLFFLPFQAFAESGESPVGEGLSYVLNHLVYGPDGMVIATLAIAGVGLACLKHTIEWRYFFYTLGGIAIIFGAPAIVSGIKSLVSVNG